jgi:hypothetical protein
MDRSSSDSDSILDKKLPPVSSRLFSADGKDATILRLRNKIRLLESRAGRFKDKIQELEERSRECPMCSGCTCYRLSDRIWQIEERARECPVCSLCTCHVQSQAQIKGGCNSPVESSLESVASSWSSNRSCMVDGYDNPNLLWDPSPFKNFNPYYGPPISPPRKKQFFYRGPKKRKQPTTRTKRTKGKVNDRVKKSEKSMTSPVTNTWPMFLKNLSQRIDNTKPQSKFRKVSLGSPKSSKSRSKISKKKAPPVLPNGSNSTSEEEF